MKSLIYDKVQVKKFLKDVLYNPFFGEVADLNLKSMPFYLFYVVRTKYFTEKQKRKYNMKSNLQFYKAVIRNESQFLRKMIAKNLESVFDKDGQVLPISSMSAYVTLNPRDVRTAAFKLQKELIDLFYRNDAVVMKLLDNLALKSYHTSPKKISRCVLDIDVESKDDATIKEIVEFLKPIELVGGIFCVVETHGGYHVYIDLAKLEKDVRKYIFQDLKNIKSDKFKEIIPNTDATVVIPGTLQGGFKVKFLDKWV
jgi:hypothetical protein